MYLLSISTSNILHVLLFHLHHNSQDLDAAEIVRIVNEIDDPADAARTLVKSSAALWAEKNDYCDDITAIVIFIKHDNVGSLGIVERPIEINHEAKQVSSKASLFRRFLQRKKKKKAEKRTDETSRARAQERRRRM
jgi:serine/threonine protein phosphatase PrpC